MRTPGSTSLRIALPLLALLALAGCNKPADDTAPAPEAMEATEPAATEPVPAPETEAPPPADTTDPGTSNEAPMPPPTDGAVDEQTPAESPETNPSTPPSQ